MKIIEYNTFRLISNFYQFLSFIFTRSKFWSFLQGISNIIFKKVIMRLNFRSDVQIGKKFYCIFQNGLNQKLKETSKMKNGGVLAEMMLIIL